MKTLDFETLGVGFGKKTIGLYKCKSRYRRHAAVLADMLVKTGTEAGSAICVLNTLTDSVARFEQVQTCLALVEKTVYAAYLMTEEEIYKYGQAKELFKYADQATEILSNEYDILASSLRTAPFGGPKSKPEPIYKKVPPKPIVIKNDDGFNDDYDPSLYD